MEDDEVAGTQFEYSDRAPTDWVLSGPLGEEGGGPGRRFDSLEDAENWVVAKHGDRVKRAVTEAVLGNRWAYLIRGGQ